MVVRGCVGDVRDDAALVDDTKLQALRNKPREVDGRVDTDGGERSATVYALGEVFLLDDLELLRMRSVW